MADSQVYGFRPNETQKAEIKNFMETEKRSKSNAIAYLVHMGIKAHEEQQKGLTGLYHLGLNALENQSKK